MLNFLKDSQISGGIPVVTLVQLLARFLSLFVFVFYCNLLINVRNVAILESLILLGFKHFFRGICLYSCLYSFRFRRFYRF